MRLDRVQAEIENRRRFLVAFPLGQQLQHFPFARREQVIAVFHFFLADLPDIIFEQQLADGRAEERLSLGDAAHGANQIVLSGVFQHVSAGTGLERAQDVSFVRVHAEDHHLRVRVLVGIRVGDLVGGLDAIQLRHSDVEHRDIGMMLRGELHGFASIVGLGDDFEIRLLLEQKPESRANDRMVVGEEDADHYPTILPALTCVSLGCMATIVAPPFAGNVLGSAADSFIVAEWRDAGDPAFLGRPIAPLHVHHSDDEAWYVLEGTLCVQSGDDQVHAAAGAAVFVKRGTPHTYWNVGPGPLRYLLVMTPNIYALIQDIHAMTERTPALLRDVFEKHDSTLLA